MNPRLTLQPGAPRCSALSSSSVGTAPACSLVQTGSPSSSFVSVNSAHKSPPSSCAGAAQKSAKLSLGGSVPRISTACAGSEVSWCAPDGGGPEVAEFSWVADESEWRGPSSAFARGHVAVTMLPERQRPGSSCSSLSSPPSSRTSEVSKQRVSWGWCWSWWGCATAASPSCQCPIMVQSLSLDEQRGSESPNATWPGLQVRSNGLFEGFLCPSLLLDASGWPEGVKPQHQWCTVCSVNTVKSAKPISSLWRRALAAEAVQVSALR